MAGNTTIATFNTQSEAARSLRAVEKVSFSLEDAQELAASDDKKSNALSLVTSMNSCPADTEQVCPEFSVIESKRFDSLYKQIDLAPEEFKSWSMKRWKTMPRPIKRHPLILHRSCPSPLREQNRI